MAGHETDNVESKSVQQADNTGDSGVGQQIAQAQNDGSFSQTFQNQQAESAKASEQMAKDGTLGNMSISGMDSQGSYGKDSAQSEGAAGKDSAVNESPKAGSDSNESPKAGSDSNQSPKSGSDANQPESKSNADDMVTTAPGDSDPGNHFPSNSPNGDATSNSAEGNNKALETQSTSNPMHGPDTDSGTDANPGGKEPKGDVGLPPLSQAAGPDSASKEGSDPATDSNGNPPPSSEIGGKPEGAPMPLSGGDANGQQSPHAGGDANGGKQEAPEQGAPSYDALGNYQGPYGQANSAEANNENPAAKPNSQGEQSPMGTMQDHMDSMKQQNGLGDSLKQPSQNDGQAGKDGYTTTGGVLTDTSMMNPGEGGSQMDMSPKSGSAHGMDDTQKNENGPSESQSNKPSENNQKPDDSGSKNNNEADKESNESKPNADKNRGGGAGFGRPSSAAKSAVPTNSPRW